MKKMMKMAVAAIIALGLSQTANAQLSNLLKKTASSAVSSSTATNVVSNLVGNLLGTNKLNEKNLVGTWTYSEPCVVLESENVLTNIGGTVVTSSIEQKFSNVLKKAKITPGKVVLKLNSDKSFTMKVNGKTTSKGTWSVSGTNLVLTMLGKSIKINASLNAGKLQLAANASKMKDLLTTGLGAASSISSSFGTVSNLLKKYNGLYLGLKFTKS